MTEGTYAEQNLGMMVPHRPETQDGLETSAPQPGKTIETRGALILGS